jgi:plastocyanin
LTLPVGPFGLRRLLPAVAFTAVAFTAVGCGGGGKKADPCPATTTVDTKNGIDFSPKCATIPVGATVTWRIADAIPHTVTFTTGGEFDKYFEKPQTVTRMFDTAGTFDYYCKVHGKIMSGKIIVTAPSPTL